MSAVAFPRARFRLGRIVCTAGLQSQVSTEDILMGIQRHQAGGWGDVAASSKTDNDHALVNGTRILSAYRAGNGTKFWLITEADRSSTVALLPEEY